jgi:hypothetical protein
MTFLPLDQRSDHKIKPVVFILGENLGIKLLLKYKDTAIIGATEQSIFLLEINITCVLCGPNTADGLRIK